MSTPVKVSARVQLTVEIDVSDTWGGNCAMDQVYDQAVEAARSALAHGIKIDGRYRSDAIPSKLRSARTIGEPKVSAVIVEETR